MLRRILFLGHKPIGEKCFDYLLKKQLKTWETFNVCTVVTNFDKDNWWKSNKIYKTADKLGIPCISNKTRATKEILESIKKYKINTIISAQSPRILEPEVLNAVNYSAFNLHNAKLPDYRGQNTTSHAILNGDTTYTTTLHWIVDTVDSGNIIDEITIPITKHDTAKSLYLKSQEKSFELFKKLLDYLIEGTVPVGKKIDTTGKLYKRDDLNQHRAIRNISKIDIKSRALYFPPFEPAYILCNHKKFYILPQDFINENI